MQLLKKGQTKKLCQKEIFSSYGIEYKNWLQQQNETQKQIEIIKEDGLIEYLTALLLLAICILLALGLFFGFGEEISWGQRIFEVTANGFFREYNLQGETNTAPQSLPTLRNTKKNKQNINNKIQSVRKHEFK